MPRGAGAGSARGAAGGHAAERWPGLGPESRALLRRAGIERLEQLRAADAVVLYLQLKALAPGTSLNMLYALVGAQEGRDWREVARGRRTGLLMQLDDLGQAPR